MTALLISVVALMLAIRLQRIRALWRHPLRNGEEWFLAQQVSPEFYRGAGAALLRRYRVSLFLPFVADAPILVWLAVTGRYIVLLVEQWVAMIASVVVYNLILVYFSGRASVEAGTVVDRPATTLHLSMAPRRLRDHTHRWVEVAVAACMLVSLAVLARGWTQASAGADRHLRHAVTGGGALFAWLLYLQLGLLMLKGVFVRWRIPLPVRRTEDFTRWRSAWLTFHLRLFDALRLIFALVLAASMTKLLLPHPYPRAAWIALIGVLALAVVIMILYLVREQRRLAVVEREIKPVELVKEFPPAPIPEGRFLAGGLLYFNRDNPQVLVRSAQGIALNLGHVGPYAWVGYFVGLLLLMTWMVR
jgi:hypothetical protein